MSANPFDPSTTPEVRNNHNPNLRHPGEIDDWPVFPALTSEERRDTEYFLKTARKDKVSSLPQPENWPPELEPYWNHLSLRKQAEATASIKGVRDRDEVDDYGEIPPEHPIRQAWAFPPPLPPGPFDPTRFGVFSGPKISHYLESMIGTDQEERPIDVWSKIQSASVAADPFPTEEQDLWLVLTGREGRLMMLLGSMDRVVPYLGGGFPCPTLIQGQPNFFTINGEAQFLGHLPDSAKLAGGADALFRLAVFWPGGEKLLALKQTTSNPLDC